MMAELWADIARDFRSAKRHYEQAAALFRSGRFEPGSTTEYYDEMALLHAMQSGYTSFEAGLKRLFTLIDERLPEGSDSHALLLLRARDPIEGLRPAIFDETLYRAADELRKFRHVAIHTYDYFDRDKADLALRRVDVFLAGLDPAIARFRAVIDPD